MGEERGIDRRFLLRNACTLGAAALVTSCARTTTAKAPEQGRGSGEEISAAEDLMREHGVLRRVLLVYDEAGRRLRAGAEVPSQVIGPAARLIRRFVEDYHEKMEERFVFPLFESDPVLGPLTRILYAQHEAGRRVTGRILSLAGPTTLGDMAGRRELADQLHAFTRMYRPHASREDTVLFPALHEALDPARYRALGERFEEEEHRMLGKNGFEHAVQVITAIEGELGIENLAQFTPH